MSEIKEFYAGKNVLVTGATGFIGKVLVEKMLRDCGDINLMYLIIRGGKNNFEQRCKDYLNHLVFNNIRKDTPQQLHKVKILNGDLSQHNLGLNSDELREIVDCVHVVLHCGANVQFDIPIWESLNINTLGTHRMLELSKQIKHLKIFVYVSTTYSQSYIDVTEECHYKSQLNTWPVVKACQRFDENTMNALTAKILGDFPNPYSFSKHLAEDLVYQYRNEFPICVVRPSVVISAIKDPYPDYCEGLNGLFGVSLGIARGIVRTIYLDKGGHALCIPVDMVANAVITTAWLHGTKENNQIEFYNASILHENSATFDECISLIKDLRYTFPFDFAIWYPNGSITACIYYHCIRFVLFQILPAIFIDTILRLFGQRPILMKAQKTIIYSSNIIAVYSRSKLRFITDRFARIQNHQNELDKIIFDTNIEKINKFSVIIGLGKGVRKYICKEKDENLPRARTVMKILYWINIIAKTIFLYYLVKFVWSRYFNNLLL